MSFSRIVFEYPVGWIDQDSDPLAYMHIRCFELIRATAKRLGLGFESKTSLRMADFAPRFAPNDALLISVHTVGIAKNVVRLKESYLPGYYYFDRTGYSGWAELAYNKKLQREAIAYNSCDVSSFIRTLKENKIENDVSKYPQSMSHSDNFLSITKPYIFLPLQTTDDFVARLSSINQLELAENLAIKTKELNCKLIIKRHPLCNDSHVEFVINKLARGVDDVHISKASVNSLISNAKAVVTVNSGVGFEALVMGVPVITAGRSDYSFVTSQISDKNDISRLKTMINHFDFVKSERFVSYYLNNYCLNIVDLDSAKRLITKWMCNDYSSMQEISGCAGMLLEESQIYMAELEVLRRRTILQYHNATCENNTIVGKKTVVKRYSNFFSLLKALRRSRQD